MTTEESRKRFTFAPKTATTERPLEWILENNRQRRNIRFALMAGIAFIAAIIMSFMSFTSDSEVKVQITSNPTSIKESATLKLSGLTYKGVTSDGNDFIVLAETAWETPEKPNLVELVSPRARVDSDADNPITLRANNGYFDRINERINFNGRVVIVRPDIGYTLRTEAAIAHLNSGIMTSDQRVRGFSPQGQVQSEGMIIGKNGQDVLFTGKSILTLRQPTVPTEN
jgi:LPS export ABC transporter protein LptC